MSAERYDDPGASNKRYYAVAPRNEVWETAPLAVLHEMIRDTEGRLAEMKWKYRRRLQAEPNPTCAKCGALFIPGDDGFTRTRTLRARYCSNACRQAAYRARKATS